MNKVLLEKLSSEQAFQKANIMKSPRTMGDAVQDVVGKVFPQCFPDGIIKKYKADFPRKAIEDVAFWDKDDKYYIVDVKTHNKTTEFNRPNLISIKRLAKLYEDDTRIFIILFVEYTIYNEKLTFTKIEFVPIEHLKWSCLDLGALGNGQLQLVDSNTVEIDRSQTRIQWMLSLCDKAEAFYIKEIAKIEKRQSYFKTVRTFWESK